MDTDFKIPEGMTVLDVLKEGIAEGDSTIG